MSAGHNYINKPRKLFTVGDCLRQEGEKEKMELVQNQLHFIPIEFTVFTFGWVLTELR